MNSKIKMGIHLSLFICLIYLVTACKPEDTTPPDPVGTNTYIFRAEEKGYNLDLYKSTDDDPLHNFVWIRFGLSSNALNFGFITVNYINSDFSSSYYNIRYENGGEIVNLGKVDGLGSITDIPTSGWTSSSAAEVGHGYVVRYKHTSEYGNTALPYYYARFYVTEYINNTTGGIGFVKVKYQNDFK